MKKIKAIKGNFWKILVGAALAVTLVGCGAQSITQEQATQIAFNHAGITQEEALSLSVKQDREDGKEVYQVQFSTNDRTYEYDIGKSTGEVVNYSYDGVGGAQQSQGQSSNSGGNKNDQSASSQTGSSQANTQGNTQSNSQGITQEEAKKIALEHAGVSEAEATIYKVQADMDDGRAVYDVEFAVGTTEYDYEIAQDTGKILSHDADVEGWTPAAGGNNTSSTTAGSITLESATQMVLERVPGATAESVRIQKDLDDGREIYEGEIYYDGAEYEFEIDASTGTFIEWSVDYQD